MIAEAAFRAMGTDGHIVVVGGRPGLVERAIERVAELERRWSRFLPDSEVSVLTAHAGEPVAVSADTRLLVQRATEAWRISGGMFDPTVLGAVVRAGYDRTFADLSRSVADQQRGATTGLRFGCTDIEIAGDTVRLPLGTGFDPGGIGKGLAADLVVEELVRDGASGACVNLGGDLRVEGESPDGTGWTVAVEHPWDDEPLALVGLAGGAVATSTPLRRRWLVDGVARHHLIDPETGEPSTTDLTLATVLAPTGWLAEILAKAVLLRGSASCFDLVDGTRAAALVVSDTGAVRRTPNLDAFLGGAEIRNPVPPRPEGASRAHS